MKPAIQAPEVKCPEAAELFIKGVFSQPCSLFY